MLAGTFGQKRDIGFFLSALKGFNITLTSSCDRLAIMTSGGGSGGLPS